MYRYDEFDDKLVGERVEQFRRQVERRLAGELSEDQFKPLRLMNGLYMQLHAYMLRVNVPYGSLSSKQMRAFAHIARTYDKGFGHFTTRQNIQYNWVKLEETPDLLRELADVEVTAIQSSGNCVRNITSDQYADGKNCQFIAHEKISLEMNHSLSKTGHIVPRSIFASNFRSIEEELQLHTVGRERGRAEVLCLCAIRKRIVLRMIGRACLENVARKCIYRPAGVDIADTDHEIHVPVLIVRNPL